MKLRPLPTLILALASVVPATAHAQPAQKPSSPIIARIEAAEQALGPIGETALGIGVALAFVLGHKIHRHKALRDPNVNPFHE